jgi:hypothetical protein
MMKVAGSFVFGLSGGAGYERKNKVVTRHALLRVADQAICPFQISGRNTLTIQSVV